MENNYLQNENQSDSQKKINEAINKAIEDELVEDAVDPDIMEAYKRNKGTLFSRSKGTLYNSSGTTDSLREEEIDHQLPGSIAQNPDTMSNEEF